MKSPRLLLPGGFGLKNTVDLYNIAQCLDGAPRVMVGPVAVPILTLLVIALLCLGINAFMNTRFVVSPLAGQRLLGVPQIGEYFRVFVAYGIIGVALSLHAWRGRGRR